MAILEAHRRPFACVHVAFPVSPTVCQHPSPQAVDESSDYLDRTHVESIFSGKGHRPEKSGQLGVVGR